jgi:TRAP transporter TAXI family solute receptor
MMATKLPWLLSPGGVRAVLRSPKFQGGIVSLAALLLIAAPALTLPVPAKRTYVLASGSAQGVYLPLAQDLAAVARRAGIDIRVVPSLGSKQNLAWLAEGHADLALAQSDTAFDAYCGRGSFPHRITAIRAIAPLYTEAVHILVRRPLYIHRVEDLRGKRIAVGPPGSGTEANAAEVLEAAGLTLDQVAARRMTVEETMAALHAGELDAAFLTSGVPTTAVTKVLADGTASLFEPDQDLMDRLREASPFFLTKDIEQTDYPRLNEQVTTIGIKALLLGRSDLDDKTVSRLVRALSSSKFLTKKYNLPDASEAAEGVAIPIFEVARHFYTIEALYHRWRLALGILAVVTISLAVFRFRRPLGRFFGRERFLWTALYFTVVWLGGSFALYWTEHRINDNYATPWKSMWSGLITIYSLSGKEPFSLPGRVIAVAIFILGVGGLVWLSEKLFRYYFEKNIIPLLRGRLTRMHKMTDHYVIAGWNEKGPGILEQLHSEDFHNRKFVVILAEESRTRKLHSHDHVHVERADQASESALRQVAVQAAHSVIVLAESSGPLADARTIQTLLAIRKICSEHESKRQVPVIAEIVEPKNVSLANYAGMQDQGTLEIVSSSELGQRLLTQAAVHPGLSNLYRKLLTFEKNNSEIHVAPMPKGFKTFSELATWTAERRSQGTDIIPIAVQRGQDMFVNPPFGKEGHLLQEGDILFALCDSAHDLHRLQKTADDH